MKVTISESLHIAVKLIERLLIFNSCLQRIGVTSAPGLAPMNLLDTGSKKHEWNYVGPNFFNNGVKLSHGLTDLDDLERHQKVGIMLSTEGDINIYIDGHHIDAVRCCTGLRIKSLWGAVDVCGKCIKIKSEMLSPPSGK